MSPSSWFILCCYPNLTTCNHRLKFYWLNKDFYIMASLIRQRKFCNARGMIYKRSFFYKIGPLEDSSSSKIIKAIKVFRWKQTELNNLLQFLVSLPRLEMSLVSKLSQLLRMPDFQILVLPKCSYEFSVLKFLGLLRNSVLCFWWRLVWYQLVLAEVATLRRQGRINNEITL